MPEPPGVAVTERPTDPAVLATVRALVAEFAAHHERTKGRPPQFGDGSTEEEILAAERHLGLRLPEELRALYRIVDGDGDCDLLFGSQMLYPLQRVLDMDQPDAPHWRDDLFSRDAVVTEAWPPGRVKRVARSDWWLEVATDGGGYSCAVDLDPGPDGNVGQVIEYSPSQDDIGYVCASVSELLRRVIEGRDNRTGMAVEARPTRAHMMGDGLTTQEIVDDEPCPDEVQRLFLNDGVEIDLAELVAFPRLRELSINRAGRVVGRLSADVPVEAVGLDAAEYDLAAFAGHPKLWKLTVTRGSVSVGALAALPALAHLDLSGVEIPDIERLVELPGLRVLELDAAQWRRLREAGAVPTGLAAAAMNGFTPLADAREWAEFMRATR
jgi:cell wall assembly regulator SMI1